MSRHGSESARGWPRPSPAARMGAVLFLEVLRARGAARGGTAVRASVHLLGVGGMTAGTDAERSGVSLLHVRRFVGCAKAELLRSDANAIALGELDGPLDSRAVHAASVAAFQVLEERTTVVDDDSSVLTRHRRIEEGDVTVFTTTDQRDPDGGLNSCSRNRSRYLWVISERRGFTVMLRHRLPATEPKRTLRSPPPFFRSWNRRALQ